ncbi:alpha/beta-Hydrolases superfamily protein [Wolffia australiana]
MWAAAVALFLAFYSVHPVEGTAKAPAALVYFPREPPPPSPETTLAAAAVVKKGKAAYKTKFFRQQLDHFTFRPESEKIFYQKYLVNDRHWDRRSSAPIFVYTGNEGNIEWFADNTGFLFDIAPKFKAMLVFIEHRFYGTSKPFGKDSYKSAKQLGYLTSSQALADYAVLIRSLKKNLTAENSPVIVFGGSYGGMLAAWFRLKYPHIAIGAVASSAPIMYFDSITPTASFYDGVSEDFKSESETCFEVIKGSWQELRAKSSQKDGLAEISKLFKSCKPIHSVFSARDWLWSAFVYTAMLDYPTAANFLKPLPAYPVNKMCKIIDGAPEGMDKLTTTIAAASLYYNYTGSERCFQIENEIDSHGLHGWNWQVCTEMVIPISASNQSMFPPYDFFFELFADSCKEKYGVWPRPHWITTQYGGENIERALKRFGSNIIFSNGMRDPWSRGGVLKNISSTIVALVTQKGAHHVDLRSATKDDPDWLSQLRSQEVKILQSWIDNYRVG